MWWEKALKVNRIIRKVCGESTPVANTVEPTLEPRRDLDSTIVCNELARQQGITDWRCFLLSKEIICPLGLRRSVFPTPKLTKLSDEILPN